jgi:hypothetical protein
LQEEEEDDEAAETVEYYEGVWESIFGASRSVLLSSNAILEKMLARTRVSLLPGTEGLAVMGPDHRVVIMITTVAVSAMAVTMVMVMVMMRGSLSLLPLKNQSRALLHNLSRCDPNLYIHFSMNILRTNIMKAWNI